MPEASTLFLAPDHMIIVVTHQSTTYAAISEPTFEPHAAWPTRTSPATNPILLSPSTTSAHSRRPPLHQSVCRIQSLRESHFNNLLQKCPPQTPARRPAPPSRMWCLASTPSTSTSGYVENPLEDHELNSRLYPPLTRENRFCEESVEVQMDREHTLLKYGVSSMRKISVCAHLGAKKGTRES